MALKDTHKLKELRSSQRGIEHSIAAVLLEEKEVAIKKKDLHKDLSDVKGKIEKLSQKELIISEHAFLRYLERVEGINLEEIQAKILTKELMMKYKTLGNGTFPIGDFKIVIRNNTVVTIKD